MEHPALNVRKIKEELTLEEIQGKVNELYKRLTFAHSTGNQALINQLEMVMEAYQRAMNEILNEMFGADGEGEGIDENIDIQ